MLIHGRDQQGRNPSTLQSDWITALKNGASKIGKNVPDHLDVAFPYYGDKLAGFAQQTFDEAAAESVHLKGGGNDNEFLAFQAQVADAIREKSGVTDDQINAEYGNNPKAKGPLNWEWVQAILRALDKHGGGMGKVSLELFTRDVFLYITRPDVQDAIDEIVETNLNDAPTVVAAHSLGTVVAYHVLMNSQKHLNVPLFITVGCPLGIRAIRDQFIPLASPPAVKAWFNAFDTRDVVALYPLDDKNFAIRPPIENYSAVKNSTENRHGISGYLDDATVADRILTCIDG